MHTKILFLLSFTLLPVSLLAQVDTAKDTAKFMEDDEFVKADERSVNFNLNFLKKKLTDKELNTDFKDGAKLDPKLLKSLFWGSEELESDRDTNELAYPFEEKEAYEFQRNDIKKKLFVGEFPTAKTETSYNHELKEFSSYIMYGDYHARPPKTYDLDSYLKQRNRQAFRQDWVDRQRYERQMSYLDFFNTSSILGLDASFFGGLFGDGFFKIRPSGSGEIQLGVKSFFSDNPQLPEPQKTQTILDFNQNIQFNVTGRIGDKLDIGFNFNTESSFDFENQLKISFKGGEDDLLQDLVIGNVNFPKVGSLIAAPSSLFGVRLDLKLGHLYVTSVVSEQKGELRSVKAESGESVRKLELKASDYEADKHFFLSKFFREHYERSLSTLPIISSGVTIQRLEVWVTNKRSSNDGNRNIVAFTDLGENNPQNITNSEVRAVNAQQVDNASNNLYSSLESLNERNYFQFTNQLDPTVFKSGIDYEKVESARLLKDTEYSLNATLGYISLRNRMRSDEVLAVAYEYVYNGKTYKVGELSTDGVNAPNTLILKLLKSSNFNPQSPTWLNMMQNVYSLNEFQVSSTDFRLNVFYEDNNTGADVPFFPKLKGKEEAKFNQQQILQILGLDQLNAQNNPGVDGNFDFVNGVTVNAENGLIIFPVLQPFGDHLAKTFAQVSSLTPSNRGQVYELPEVKQYAFPELYNRTITNARQFAKKDRYKIKIQYKSSSNTGIPLNSFNVQRGSVKVVTEEGIELRENSDYIVDYGRGVVLIKNPLYSQPGVVLNVTSESNTLFNQQAKTFIGTRFNYRPNKKFNLGGTYMYYSEKPLTQKVNTGQEPVENMVFGVDGQYTGESFALTQAVNYLPNIESNTPSNFTVSGEFAYLKPDVSDGVGGQSFIDDFETSESSINLKDFFSWELSSTPVFPSRKYDNFLEYGYNRAKIAWYDISFFLNFDDSNPAPDGVTDRDKAGHYSRFVSRNELFPNRDQQFTSNSSIPMLDVAFYPRDRGPYNFDVEGKPGLSAGLENETAQPAENKGKLKDPKSRWGGIMRRVPVTNFEESNIEYIEFWMMDPFLKPEDRNQTGELIFNLGEISEDILRDGRRSAEQNLPINGASDFIDTIPWGLTSSQQSLNNDFDNTPSSRPLQDVGFDGLNDEQEKSFFAGYLQNLLDKRFTTAFENYEDDPSGDNYLYYRDPVYNGKGILERYKNFSAPEGNSAIGGATETTGSNSNDPNSEDINQDNTLNENNDYYEYKIKLSYDMPVGSEYIIDKKRTNVERFGVQVPETIWYKFRIPVKDGQKVGNISNFTSIRFIRMYMTQFEKPVVCRFASLNLIRSDWRKFEFFMEEERLGTPLPSLSDFEVSSVNIEQNERKEPVNYILPPNVTREQDLTNQTVVVQNEQSLALKVLNLPDGEARSVFKAFNLDMRRYRRLSMDVHAEAIANDELFDNELKLFIRIGSDMTQNYYEYELPLKVTPAGFYGGSDQDRRTVWPLENRIDLLVDELTNAKLQRNKAYQTWKNEDGSPKSFTDLYTTFGSKEQSKIYVKGSPSLAEVSTILIGVRNPGDNSLARSGEIWVNELKLTDFDHNGGWATKGNFNTNFADFSQMTLSGSYTTPGFGNIDQLSFDRSTELVRSFNYTQNFALGRLFPSFLKLQLPLSVNVAQKTETPEYDPFDTDVRVEDKEQIIAADKKEAYAKSIEDKTMRRGINISQFKFNLGDNMLWSPKNLSTSISYNDAVNTSPSLDYDRQYNLKIGAAYAWSGKPITIKPFENIGFLKSKHLGLINQFHLNLTPSNFFYRTTVVRDYKEIKAINVNNPSFNLPANFQKRLDINTQYGFTFDPMKHLKFNFNADQNSLVDEDSIQGNWGRRVSEAFQLIGDNLFNTRQLKYKHRLRSSYQVPFRRIPALSFVNANLSYNADMNWQAAPLLPQRFERLDVGNTLSNNNSLNARARINLQRVYRQFDLVSKPVMFKEAKKRTQARGFRSVFQRNGITFRLKRPIRFRHRLGTEDVSVSLKDTEGKDIPNSVDVIDKNTVAITTEKTYRRVQMRITPILNETKKEESSSFEGLSVLWQYFRNFSINTLTMLKSTSVSYSKTSSSLLPGYKPQAGWFGLDNWEAPGWQYAAGWVREDFGLDAAKKGWLVPELTHNTAYLVRESDRFQYDIKLEPIPSLNITLKGNMQQGKTTTRFISQANYDPNNPLDLADQLWEESNKTEAGNYNTSAIFVRTAFEKIQLDKTGNYSSSTINQLYKNLPVVAQRLAANRKQAIPSYQAGNGLFPKGYTASSQEVLLPAVLSAFTGGDANSVNLNHRLDFPLPSWNVRYTGLSQLDLVKSYIGTITLNHTYSGAYNTGQYFNNINYKALNGQSATLDKAEQNYLSKLVYSRVSITDKFSPLVGVDLRLNSGLSLTFNYSTSRNVNLSLANQQLTQTNQVTYTIGAGYTIKTLPFFLKTKAGRSVFNNDIRLNFNFSLTDDQTHVYKLSERYGEIINGKNLLSIRSNATYTFSERLRIKLYFDYTSNDPKRGSFFTSTTRYGLGLKYTFNN